MTDREIERTVAELQRLHAIAVDALVDDAAFREWFREHDVLVTRGLLEVALAAAGQGHSALLDVKVRQLGRLLARRAALREDDR